MLLSESFFILLSASVPALTPLHQVNELSAPRSPLAPAPWVEAPCSGIGRSQSSELDIERQTALLCAAGCLPRGNCPSSTIGRVAGWPLWEMAPLGGPRALRMAPLGDPRALRISCLELPLIGTRKKIQQSTENWKRTRRPLRTPDIPLFAALFIVWLLYLGDSHYWRNTTVTSPETEQPKKKTSKWARTINIKLSDLKCINIKYQSLQEMC